jgi:iron complex transport system ATP-binding protein
MPTAFGDPPGPALRFDRVGLNRSSTPVLHDVSWEVRQGERWVLLGPNGSGKTTMLQLASGYLHPTRGSVEVLGERLGHTDVRALRRLVSLVSASLARAIDPRLTALEVVVAGGDGALEPWWRDYPATDWEEARALLADAGAAYLAGRAFGKLSEGERQQALLARALMGSPQLVLLDEPCAGLDMGARERLLARLSELAGLSGTPPLVMVTHHVEEVPAGFTHAMLLRQGRPVCTGPIASTLTAEQLSRCFAVPLELSYERGRWSSRLSSVRPRRQEPSGTGGPCPVAAQAMGSRDSSLSLMSETE